MKPQTTPYGGTRTEPTRHLYAGHDYKAAHATDIRELFKRIREEEAERAAKQAEGEKQ